MSRRSLHSRRLVTPEGVRDATVSWDEGRIVSVADGSAPRAGFEFESAGDLVVGPGLVDPHVHINEPGRTEWEGFESATRAAAAGGVTTVVDMPLNSTPVTTTPEALELKREAARGRIHVHCGFHGGVIPANADRMAPLLGAGVLGIKAFLTHSGIDEFPNVSESDLLRAVPALVRHDALLLVHCELDSPHAGASALALAPRSHRAWLASRPRAWENRAVALVLALAERTGLRVHIVHVSSAEALAPIAAARSRGVRVTAETCPHYLLFAAEDIEDGAVEYKCAPPIRERENNEQLWEALQGGALDLVASDHSPAPPALKQVERGDFARAWGGIAGLQFGLRAFWTGARTRGFTLEQTFAILSGRPAELLGLSGKGAIAPGRDADLVVWDPEAEARVAPEEILHRHALTPYSGMRLSGVIQRTYVSGEPAFEHARVTGPPRGTLLPDRRP